MAKRWTVLVAVVAEVRPRLVAVLRHCELVFVDSLPALHEVLDARRWDLLLVGSHFDDSRPLASLAAVMARKPAFPVVYVHGAPLAPPLGRGTVHAMRLASAALGAEYFVDLPGFPDDGEGNARVRAMLERLLEIPPRSP